MPIRYPETNSNFHIDNSLVYKSWSVSTVCHLAQSIYQLIISLSAKPEGHCDIRLQGVGYRAEGIHFNSWVPTVYQKGSFLPVMVLA